MPRHFQQYFSYIMATNFSGGRSQSTWREPPTMGQATGKHDLKLDLKFQVNRINRTKHFPFNSSIFTSVLLLSKKKEIQWKIADENHPYSLN
jgi:hypothetical protein